MSISGRTFIREGKAGPGGPWKGREGEEPWGGPLSEIRAGISATPEMTAVTRVEGSRLRLPPGYAPASVQNL